MKDLNAHLSAIAPVGIVAVVSMNTIWKRNNANTPTSYTLLFRKYPTVPAIPKSCPKRCTIYSCGITPGPPPRVADI